MSDAGEVKREARDVEAEGLFVTTCYNINDGVDAIFGNYARHGFESACGYFRQEIIPEFEEKLASKDALISDLRATLKHDVDKIEAAYMSQLSAKDATIAKLRAALEFYADEGNWSYCTSQTTSHMIGPDDHYAIEPFGEKFVAGLVAHKALKETEGGRSET